MKYFRVGLVGLLFLGLMMYTPMRVVAGEHGGSEHGGQKAATQEHGGGSLAPAEGSHTTSADVTSILQAAKILEEINPRLSRDLERIAKELGE